MKVKRTENLLKISQVASIFAVTPRTIYHWIKKGKIAAVALPFRGCRINLSEVERLKQNLKPKDIL